MHKALIQAICDLALLEYSLLIDFGFVRVEIFHQNMRYSYQQHFAGELNETPFELKMRKSDL